MAEIGREFGRRLESRLMTAPLGARVRLGVGSAISAAGFVTLAVQALSAIAN